MKTQSVGPKLRTKTVYDRYIEPVQWTSESWDLFTLGSFYPNYHYCGVSLRTPNFLYYLYFKLWYVSYE